MGNMHGGTEEEPLGRDTGLLERETGIAWDDKFTDVPDDGNCSMHAFWLGLRTLVQLYPEVADPTDELLPCSPDAFRVVALQRMVAEAGYSEAVENQLRLWMQLDTTDLLGMEDFFMLPSELQGEIVNLRQSALLTGGDDIDFADLTRRYIESMMHSREADGRRYFIPLGGLELELLCQLYQVRLQLVKSEALESMRQRFGRVDPRRIDPGQLHDRQPEGGSARVVRIVNMNSNHFQVHLPVPRERSSAAAVAGAAVEG